MKIKKRIDIGYYIAEGARSIVSHGLMSFAAVCMIIACLVIMGSFAMVAINAEQMLSQAESENEFKVYIDETYTEQQITELQKKVAAVANVDSVEFSTKEQAKADFLKKHGNDGLYADMPDDVFRDRFTIRVFDLEQFQQTVDAVCALPGVADHQAEPEVAEGFVMIRNVASALATILIGILVVISLFIISNTIRLATFTRREEIAIMKMCGATNWFIRWPFIFEGLMLGVTGGVIAYFIQWGIYAAIYDAMARGGFMTLFPLISFQTLSKTILEVFLGSGAIIGGGGSVLAIRKFLQV